MSNRRRQNKRNNQLAKRNTQAQKKSQPPSTAVVKQTEIQQFSGPLPAPFILESYEKIVPGAAERILQMAEQDAEHQRLIESGVLNAATSDSKRGQVFGLVVALAALSASVVALIFGYDDAASIIGGTTVVGLASVFVIGRILRDKD